MHDHLVVVAPDKEELEGGNVRHVFDGMRNYAYPLEGAEVDIDRLGWAKEAKSWMCVDRDVERVAAALTHNFPGRDINVYKLTTVYYRVPGEMQSKTVTKDGVLPNMETIG